MRLKYNLMYLSFPVISYIGMVQISIKELKNNGRLRMG